jgi:hypothetical protein
MISAGFSRHLKRSYILISSVETHPASALFAHFMPTAAAPPRQLSRLLTRVVITSLAAVAVAVTTGVARGAPQDLGEAGANQTKSVDSEAAGSPDEAERRTFSPLHDLLGIDPDTGQFVPPQSASASRAEEQPGEEVGESRSGDRETPGAADSRRRPPGPDQRALRTAEETRRAIRELSQQINRGSFEGVSSVLDDQLGGGSFARIRRQVGWVTGALLLIYPLSIVLAELLGWLRRATDREATELDRRYWAARLRRRLVLAGVVTALIVVACYGSVHGYWWNQPGRFTVFFSVLIALGLAAAVLLATLKRAAREHELAVMRETRRHVLEMRKDLEDLRNRVRRVTISSE